MMRGALSTGCGLLFFQFPPQTVYFNISRSADLWSVGCIVHEFLYGFAPFQSETYAELVEKILATTPVFVPTEPPMPATARHLIEVGGLRICVLTPFDGRLVFSNDIPFSSLNRDCCSGTWRSA